MTEQDFEQLSRYMDGELAASERAAVQLRLESDSDFAAAYREMETFSHALQAEFSKPGSDNVAAATRALLADSGNVVAFPSRRQTVTRRLFAAAATVAAVSVVYLGALNGAGTPNTQQLLSAALESSPSQASGWQTLADGSQLRPLLSFQHTNGSWCREYLRAQADDAVHGVACRTGTDTPWQTVVHNATTLASDSADYRPANAADTEAVAAWVQQHAADIPLSLSQEAEIIANQWQ